MRQKGSKNRKKSTNQEYWQSYSDLMAALLLVFTIMVAVALYSYQIKQKELDVKKEEVTRQEEQLGEALARNAEIQETLDDMIGIKASIIGALQTEFESAGIPVTIDEKTGDITFNESTIRFATAESTLTTESKLFLDQFMPLYINTLLTPEFLPNIAAIVIEGHTDSVGGYMYNLNLSQERAFSVANYCLEEASATMTPTELERLQKLLTANGRSYSDRIFKNDGTEDFEASRRVIFKFRLKDESTIEKIRELISDGTE